MKTDRQQQRDEQRTDEIDRRRKRTASRQSGILPQDHRNALQQINAEDVLAQPGQHRTVHGNDHRQMVDQQHEHQRMKDKEDRLAALFMQQQESGKQNDAGRDVTALVAKHQPFIRFLAKPIEDTQPVTQKCIIPSAALLEGIQEHHGAQRKQQQHHERMRMLLRHLECDIRQYIQQQDVEHVPVAVADALPSDQRQKDPGEIVILLCDRPDEGKQQDHDDKAGQQFHDLDWQLVHIVIALFADRDADPVSGIKQKGSDDQLSEKALKRRIQLAVRNRRVKITGKVTEKHQKHEDAVDLRRRCMADVIRIEDPDPQRKQDHQQKCRKYDRHCNIHPLLISVSQKRKSLYRKLPSQQCFKLFYRFFIVLCIIDMHAWNISADAFHHSFIEAFFAVWHQCTAILLYEISRS